MSGSDRPRRRAPGAGRKPSAAVAERNRSIVEAYLSGRTVEELMKQHQLSQTGVYKALRSASVVRPRSEKAAPSAERVARRRAYMQAYHTRWLADPETRERRNAYLRDYMEAYRLDPGVRAQQRRSQAAYRNDNRALLREKSREMREFVTEEDKLEAKERRGAERLARLMSGLRALEKKL